VLSLDLQARQDDLDRCFLCCCQTLALLQALCTLSAKQLQKPKTNCVLDDSRSPECRKSKPPCAVTLGLLPSPKSTFNSGLKSTHNLLLTNERTHNKPPPQSPHQVPPCQSPSPTFTHTLISTPNIRIKFESFVSHTQNLKPQPVSYTTTSTKRTAPTHGEQKDSLRRCPRKAREARGVTTRTVGLCFSGGLVEKRTGKRVGY
jgi:hypothetical protein